MNRRPLAAAIAALALSGSPAAADAPKVSSFFPAGARRGETVQVEAAGEFKPWPVEALADRPGVEFKAEEESGRFAVTVAPDATPGVCWIRVFNDEGAATLRPFVIGTVPELVEVEPNDANDEAMPIEGASVVINGRLQRRGNVDAFAVPLEPGQTLVASVEANRPLGSPMDAVLQVVSPEGFVVDHADDAPFFDPALAFTAPTSGVYLVRVFAFPAQPDSSIRFASGDDYIYRLTLSTQGHFDHAHPSAVTRGTTPQLIPVGPDLDDDSQKPQLTPITDREAVAWRDDLPGVASVAVVDVPVVVGPEEPGDGETSPIPLPAVICGRIAAEGESDTLPIQAPEGRSITVRVAARSLGSPLDPVLTILDASGKELSEVDDTRNSADPEATLTVPAGGILRLVLRDLHGRGGPGFIYRIEAREAAPDFAITVESDHVELSPGKPLEVSVSVARNNFDQPIPFEAEGLPEGVSLEPAVAEPGARSSGDQSRGRSRGRSRGPSQEVTLRLVGDDVPPWSGPIRLIGRPEGDGPTRAATAPRVDGSRTDALWLTVLPAD